MHREMCGSPNAVTMEYESKLFDTEQIMDIDILMEEEDWKRK